MAIAVVGEKKETLAGLLERLGSVSPERVMSWPPPGMATEDDLLAVIARRTGLYELVDGALVEKPMGWFESSLAAQLISLISLFLKKNNLGIILGEAGLIRLVSGLVRAPDVSFISWQRFPDFVRPREQVLPVAPDLAVEVLSPSNTEGEMNRKRREYFQAGARLVWILDPPTATVQVYTGPDDCVRVTAGDELDGADVLPGFRLRVQDWIDSAWRPPAHGAQQSE